MMIRKTTETMPSDYRHFKGTESIFVLAVVKLTSQNTRAFWNSIPYKVLRLHPGLSMESPICHTRRPHKTVWKDRIQWS